MASIPVLHSRWRCKSTSDVVEVEEVACSAGTWITVCRRLAADGGAPRIIANAHWFTTVGYEPVLEAGDGDQ